MAGVKGRVADAAHDCIASFDAIAQVFLPEAESSTTASELSRNEDGRSRFQIWMSNLGAAHPATDRRSADYRLREAPEVVDRIVELLEELTEINGEALEIVSGERSNRHIAEEDSDTDSLSPSSGQDELSELFLSIGDVLTSLFRVSMLVKKATTGDRYARAASAKDKPYLAEFDIRHVADKFPKAREQPWLLERLGTAITQRRQFLRYCRNHKNRIAHVSSSDTAVSGQDEDAVRPLYEDRQLGLPVHNTHGASSTKTPMTRPTLSPTAASTLQPDRIVREDLQDLDDNDDAVSQSTSVAYSQATGEGSGHLRVVRLQDLSHHHEPFECPYCFSIVQARRQRSWRKHVLSDLRAYVCMFEDCDAGLFEDKAAWALHDAEEHRRQWDCQHCRHTCRPFSSSHGLHEHMRFYHAGDELPAEVLTQVVKASSRPLNETAPDCPLCDFDTEIHRQADRTGQAIPSGSQAVIPLVELQKHLAIHQEQLALFAIPPAVERGVESESRHGKDQVGLDEQTKMMADWRDHLSELDATDDLERLPNVESNIDSTAEFEESYPSPPAEAYSDEDTPAELPGVVPTLDEPQELESPDIVPGDIVYIRRQTGEQLTYSKAVYLGDPGGGQHIARNWDTKNDLKVSLSELVRKEDVTEDERIEAESIKAYVAIQDSETLSKSRFYLKHATLPPEIKSPFIMRTNKLATGDEWLSGYDREMVQKACSAFLKFETQIMGRSVRVEELVRMFYASAVTAAPGPKKRPKNEVPSSDNARTAAIKRNAALLTDVLIGVVDEASEQVFPERDIVSAQLREEYSGMLSRANSAVKDDVGSTHRDQLKEAELSPEFLDALKSRLAIVIKGEETAVTLPKLGAHLMEQACSSFLFRLQSAYPADRAIPLETTLGEFLACAETEIRHDRAGSNKEGRSVAAERLVALFLSLLISIDAALELERLAGFPPRIRNQFTAVLMEERSRYLSQASEIEERLFRVSQRSKPEFDIHFFTENSRHEHDKRYGKMIAGRDHEPNDLDDPSQSKYCYCLRGSHGVMVACDGPNCRRKWFHLSCTDLKKPLTDYKTWFCVFCQPPMKTAAEDIQEVSTTATIDAGDAEPELKETQEPDSTAKERPPRGMVCNNCKFVWRSASALELRDCPNCGSYSVFAESPPRTTSPEATEATLRPDATGEEAIGQYFSERTNKFMSLYRRETLAEESKSEVPRESFPDPWSHLHTSSSANSPRLEESPSALPEDSLPDVGASENTTGDGSTLVTNPDLQRVRRTIMYLIHTAHRLNEVFQLIPGSGTSSRSGAGDSDVKEVYDQLCSVAKTLNDLLQWQDNDPRGEGLRPEWALKLQSFQSSLSTLCSSITITIEDMGNALGSGETKRWEEMAHKMENDEGVDCSKRLQWYQNFTTVLFSLAEGSIAKDLSPVKLRLEENISTLLRLQESYVLRAGQEQEAAATIAQGPAIESPYIGASDSLTRDASWPMDASDSFKVRQLRRALDQIDYAEVVLYDAIDRDSNGNFTGVKEIRDVYGEFQNFDSNLRRLLHHQRRDTECRTKLMRSGSVVSTLCSSMQNTVEDILIAIDSNNTMQWTDLVRMMEDVELVGLQQRLKLYQDVLINLTETQGRDSEYWLKRLDADVLELLVSQESNSSQAARRNSHRWAIWPSHSGYHYPRVEGVQNKGGLTQETVRPETASSDRGREVQEDREVTFAGSADRLRVSAPSPPSSPIEKDEVTTLSGDPVTRRRPYTGSSEEEEETILFGDPASASHHRSRQSQKEPADMSAGPANPRRAHGRQPEPHPRPAPRRPDWTPKKLADLMLQRGDDGEPALASERPAVSTISEEPPRDPSDRGRAHQKEPTSPISSEDPASASPARGREGQQEAASSSAGFATRKPAHRRPERITSDASEEEEESLLSGKLAGTSHDHGREIRMESARQSHERTLYDAPREEGVDDWYGASAGSDDTAQAPIRFKDAVGRKFSFPWHLCKTWKGMESLIKQAFLHVDVIGAHVQEGHYDLMGPEGEIILPQVWDAMIKPDWEVSMHMWPIPETPKKGKKGKKADDAFDASMAQQFAQMGTGQVVNVEPVKVKKPKKDRKKANRLSTPSAPPPPIVVGPSATPPVKSLQFNSREEYDLYLTTGQLPNSDSPKPKPRIKKVSSIAAWMAGAPDKPAKKRG